MKRTFLMIAPVAALAIVLAGCGKNAGTNAGTTTAQSSAMSAEAGTGAGAGTGTEVVAGSEAETVSLVSFSEDQKHRGDLILVNKEYAYDFDANAALNLVRITDAQSYKYPVSSEELKLSEKIMPQLDAMIRACDEAMGTTVTSISSAWRSKEYQQNVWDEYAELYGESYSRKYVANPGNSEHHTGLAADLGIIYSDGSEGTFSESDNAVWMAANSWRYGFVRRYAEDKVDITGISNEAWHFRYVGQPHAAYMHEKNLCLEEYLSYLRENTSPSNPLKVEVGDRSYSVFYTNESTITEPEDSYTVSGDNVGGYIVTKG